MHLKSPRVHYMNLQVCFTWSAFKSKAQHSLQLEPFFPLNLFLPSSLLFPLSLLASSMKEITLIYFFSWDFMQRISRTFSFFSIPCQLLDIFQRVVNKPSKRLYSVWLRDKQLVNILQPKARISWPSLARCKPILYPVLCSIGKVCMVKALHGSTHTMASTTNGPSLKTPPEFIHHILRDKEQMVWTMSVPKKFLKMVHCLVKRCHLVQRPACPQEGALRQDFRGRSPTQIWSIIQLLTRWRGRANLRRRTILWSVCHHRMEHISPHLGACNTITLYRICTLRQLVPMPLQHRPDKPSPYQGRTPISQWACRNSSTFLMSWLSRIESNIKNRWV